VAEILNTISKSIAMVQMYDFWSTFAECFTRYDNRRVWASGLNFMISRSYKFVDLHSFKLKINLYNTGI
jgi:hypothetical protein